MTRVESEISGVGCSLLRRRRPQPRRNYVGNDLRRPTVVREHSCHERLIHTSRRSLREQVPHHVAQVALRGDPQRQPLSPVVSGKRRPVIGGKLQSLLSV